MQPNNLYADPYSPCSNYWKVASAASSSSDLSKSSANHSNRLSYSLDHPHLSSSHYGSSTTGLSSQIDIKSEHSSPMKNSQLAMSGEEDSNESHPMGSDDEHDDLDEDIDLKSQEKDEQNNSQSNVPRKSNRRAEKPPCKRKLKFNFFFSIDN